MSPSNHPPEPWNSFFKELDEAVDTTVRLDCVGGFVVTLLYGLERPTADIDVIELAPRNAAETMMDLGIRGGPLHQKYHIYLDRVTVATIPESYEDRLVEMFPGAYRNLHLMLSILTTWPSPNSKETTRRIATTCAFWRVAFPSTSTSFRSVTRRNCAGNSSFPREKI